eukprot:COSAG01_NODE_18396_length_1078_cov_8.130746_3_plen_95_part_00
MLQEMDVYAGPAGSVQVGRLSQVYSCCGSEIDVIVNGQLTYRISGPACVCDGERARPACRPAGACQSVSQSVTAGPHASMATAAVAAFVAPVSD